MKNFAPYTIIHLDLSNGLEQLQKDVVASPAYFVFWWKQIPLGQLYINQKELLSVPAFLQKIINAIEPAITHYTKKEKIEAEEWKSFINTKEEVSFQTFMHSIVKKYAPALHKQLSVTIIICTRDRPDNLKTCLLSLNSMKEQPAQIIVVDNAPSDDRTKEVTALFPQVTYLKEAKKGLDIARNTGIRNAAHSLVAFLDDDVLLHSSWLGNVWSTFEDESIAAMTGLVLVNSMQTEAQFIFEKYWGFNRGFTDNYYDAVYFENTLKSGPPVWKIGAGANMAFRTSAFEKAGLFDERLDAGAAGCNGDSELWCRMLSKGLTIQYNPRAVLFHEHRQSERALKQQIRAYMRGFTAACLFQQNYTPGAGYRKHLLQVLPKYYLQQLQRGFPTYEQQYKTVRSEITGIISGWIFYFKNRKKPSCTGSHLNEHNN